MTPTDVLYITSLKSCPGTDEAMRIIREFNNPTHVIVQDIASLKKEGVSIPSWLKGTPTLVNVATRAVSEGTAALRRLPEICEMVQSSASGGEESVEDEGLGEDEDEDDGMTIGQDDDEVIDEHGDDRAMTDQEEEEVPHHGLDKQSGGSLNDVDELHDWEAATSEENGNVTEDAIKRLLHERGMSDTGNVANVQRDE